MIVTELSLSGRSRLHRGVASTASVVLDPTRTYTWLRWSTGGV